METQPRDILLRLRQNEERRAQLIEAGLLDKEQEVLLPELSQIASPELRVLDVFAQDAELKLRVFNRLWGQIDAFLNSINSRFLYKTMYVNRKEGFSFKLDTGEALSAHQLSSGEQHELVMLYEFLFRAKQDSLVLIDEPEISLHVTWQRQFLADLEKITKLSQFCVLIATHFPSIIDDRFDLAVELQGPTSEQIPYSKLPRE